MTWAIILIVLGILLLLDNLRMIDFGYFISRYWPLFLVLIGLRMIIFPKRSSDEKKSFDSVKVRVKKMRESISQILFSLDGRINRAKFWLYILPLNIIWIGGLIIDSSITSNPGTFYWLGILICFWPALALNVKRCHDRDKSGWFYLVAFIPIVGLWYLIEIGFLRGTKGNNRFGPDPLGQVVS